MMLKLITEHVGLSMISDGLTSWEKASRGEVFPQE